ncbi:MAG: HAD hydrolase-like protein [Rubrobacter sp.]
MEIKGILVDINGTLTVGDEPLSGAVEAMRLLKDSGIAVRYTSNIDSRPRSEVAGWLESLGFPVEEGEVFTPTIAAARRLRGMRCHALVNQSVLVDLGGVEFVPGDVDEADEAGAAEAVLVGDVRGDFTYENLDRAFGHLACGAELFALQKNRSRQSRRPGGVSLDTGAFVAALEYASGKRATVFGKPEEPFFDLALEDLGLERGTVAVVGDDLYSDVGGARAAGLFCVQVKTGKYDSDSTADDGEGAAGVGADETVEDFSRVPSLLGL